MNRGRIEQQGSPDEVYDRPASPFVLQFLGDVNIFRGRIGQSLATGEQTEVSYVRPHELEIIAEAGNDAWPVTLSQTLTVGPNTRLEFRHDPADSGGEDGFVDVELPREQFVALRDRLGLQPGARVHLRPKRVTRPLCQDRCPIWICQNSETEGWEGRRKCRGTRRRRRSTRWA
ncbi:MAG: TOBE-like domain-containing protein [Pseudomonadota bacterium]|nr:TOBE-like domain-containing protein [Pseudomonadota bacterium]